MVILSSWHLGQDRVAVGGGAGFSFQDLEGLLLTALQGGGHWRMPARLLSPPLSESMRGFYGTHWEKLVTLQDLTLTTTCLLD